MEERTGLQAEDLPALRVNRLEEGIGAGDLADARRTVAELRRFATPEDEATPSPSPSLVPEGGAPAATDQASPFQPDPLNT